MQHMNREIDCTAIGVAGGVANPVDHAAPRSSGAGAPKTPKGRTGGRRVK